MDAIECLKTRRSNRQYRPDPVPREVIEDIIDCARLAPTAMGVQPWEFIVVEDEGTRRALAELCDYGPFIADAPVCIVVFAEDVKYYLEDGSAATTAVLLAARAHGLGSCWVAGDKKPYADAIRELLGVPESHRLISLVSVGYAAEEPSPEKRPLADVLHWERYSG